MRRLFRVKNNSNEKTKKKTCYSFYPSIRNFFSKYHIYIHFKMIFYYFLHSPFFIEWLHISDFSGTKWKTNTAWNFRQDGERKWKIENRNKNSILKLRYYYFFSSLHISLSFWCKVFFFLLFVMKAKNAWYKIGSS